MSRSREDGFVLIAVIWFVALLAFGATIISSWMFDSLGRAAALNDRIEAERDVVSATDQVAYLMISSYYVARGLIPVSDSNSAVPVNPMGFTPFKGSNVIPLDGRPYRFGTGIVELQDTKGLFNLADIDPYSFSHLLGYYGISSQESFGLLDKLLDYQDKNTTVKRLNGANRDAYVHAGLTPPRNNPLLTPWEPYRVMGWDRYPALWRGPVGFGDLTTVVPATHGFNPNTAPPALLRSLPGVSQDAVDKLIRYREVQTISTLIQMQNETGLTIPIDALSVSPFPANTLRAEISFPGYPTTRMVQFTTPTVGPIPYRVDYAFDVPRTPRSSAALEASNLAPYPTAVPAP